jgi:hypothetical protein
VGDTALMTGLAGVGGAVIVTFVLPVMFEREAVIVAEPAPIGSTTAPTMLEFGIIDATELFDVLHVTFAVTFCKLPSEYVPVTVSVSDWDELSRIVGFTGVTDKLVSVGVWELTVTVAVPQIEPVHPLTVVEPAAKPNMFP